MNTLPGIRPHIVRLRIKPITDHFACTIDDIKGKSRKQNICIARHFTAYYLRSLGFTLVQVGAFLNRDYSTIIMSCNYVKTTYLNGVRAIEIYNKLLTIC